MATDLSPTRTDPAPRGRQVPVAEVMRPPLTTVEIDAHLAGAAYLIKHSGTTALLVTTTDEPQRLRAIVTDADIAQAVADGRNLEETRIRDLASTTLITVGPQVAVDEAARVMLAHHIHHLPVVDGDRLLGLVDMADVCRAFLGDEG
jgi:CBS domain-containing protein